jgi:putative ABC transport system permease protein
MNHENLVTAIQAVWRNRMRSILTTLGIVIGITSVIVVVAIGQGVKRQIARQTSVLSKDIVFIRPSAKNQLDILGLGQVNNSISGSSISSFNSAEVKAIGTIAELKDVTPIGIIPGEVSYQARKYSIGSVVSTAPEMFNILNPTILYGNALLPEDAKKNVAVLGKPIADQIFQEQNPVGKTFQIGTKDFVVVGIIDSVTTSTVDLSFDYNTAVIIPSDPASALLSADAAPLTVQILARLVEGKNIEDAKASIVKSIDSASGGKHPVPSVNTSNDTIEVTSYVFRQITFFIGSIAFISLVVGSVGIMNSMYAMVNERSREIGIRKAIGASNGQILQQFVTESVILCCFGGIVGLVFSGFTIIVLNLITDLQPIFTWQIALITLIVSIATGIVSGILPALKAASKDPIAALRNDQ